MSDNTLNNFEITLKHLFLLKDCYELILETVEDDIELSTWDIEERQEMLVAIDEIIDVVKSKLPKFVIQREQHLKLVPKIQEEIGSY